MAAEALWTVEAALTAARPQLKERLAGLTAQLPDYHQLEPFFQTVTAAGDAVPKHCPFKQPLEDGLCHREDLPACLGNSRLEPQSIAWLSIIRGEKEPARHD